VGTPGDFPLRLMVPFDIGRLSPNRRAAHWGQDCGARRAARLLAQDAWRKAGSPKAAGKIRLSFLIRRPRSMDPDNLIAVLKPILDGLCCGQLTPDDGARWVELGSVAQETGRKFALREEVMIEVEEVSRR
jgi:hypothetical protein